MTTAERDRAIELALEEAEVLAAAKDHLSHGQTAQARHALERALGLTFKRAPAVPVSLAARLLGVSEPTVRKWITAGVLRALRMRPVGVDPGDVFEVMQRVRELREHGQDPTIRELLLARIEDDLLLGEPVIQQTLREMREGKIRWVHQ